MPNAPDTAVAGPSMSDGGFGNPNPSGLQKRMQEATGVYDYDNTMRPMSPAQRRTSDGTVFKQPAMKQIARPGSRTFI